ncbi:hypothetical protein Goari_011894 [Gossypium aridum]|uniref:RNase H type-1 domain-containing protein n=1 Tax=Gossypium aridum TaxID=34290 RepID=A0A7J8WYZ5_GOSAI|nr:hypothetical protein [Gossypium aridum]
MKIKGCFCLSYCFFVDNFPHGWNYVHRPFSQLQAGRVGSVERCAHWNLPPMGKLKCNMDVTNMTAWALMARDPEGAFIGCCLGFWDGCMEANTSEELAAQEAIAWLKEMSFDMVLPEPMDIGVGVWGEHIGSGIVVLAMV